MLRALCRRRQSPKCLYEIQGPSSRWAARQAASWNQQGRPAHRPVDARGRARHSRLGTIGIGNPQRWQDVVGMLQLRVKNDIRARVPVDRIRDDVQAFGRVLGNGDFVGIGADELCEALPRPTSSSICFSSLCPYSRFARWSSHEAFVVLEVSPWLATSM